MKLDWITDPHVNHLKGAPELIKFADRLHARKSDGLLITGDIGESHNICDLLTILSGAYQRPIYFVLGNHDYYGDWMAATHEKVQAVCGCVPEGILNWLPMSGPIQLTEDTTIIGHGGFYDGQCGEGAGTEMGMYDFKLKGGIPDLAEALMYGTHQLFDKLLQLGTTCANFLEHQIHEAVQDKTRRVLILTHVPPFHEASHFRGRPSDKRSAPFYVNKSMGDMLRRVTAEYPHVTFDVYAGHTHGKRHYQAEENLNVFVGSARYARQPTFQKTIEV
jgi:predicted phosphodiesterase